MCDTLTATLCVVSSIHDVVADSTIDCDADSRDIEIDGDELRVHDAAFTLIGKSLLLENGGKIVADCPQSFEHIGFAVRVAGAVDLPAAEGGKLEARCGVAGGEVRIEAEGDVTIDALGIDANGSSPNAPGGTIAIDSEGTVTIRADLTAEATGGEATGGTIEIIADDIRVESALRVKGYGGSTSELSGGEITLRSENDVLITAGGGLNAESSQGGGGEIEISAVGLVDVQRALALRGTSGSDGVGGSVGLEGEEVRVNADVTCIGGRDGGVITIDARSGGISIGTGSHRRPRSRPRRRAPSPWGHRDPVPGKSRDHRRQGDLAGRRRG